MNLGYRIRPGTPIDAALLPEVERTAARLFTEYADDLGLTPDMLERTESVEDMARAAEAGLLWVAVTPDDAPVGFAYLVRLDECIHLDELDVLPAHGRGGLGSALLRRVCAWAAAAGLPGVTLTTNREVPWNAPFYTRRGFRVLGEAELTPGLVTLRESEHRRGLRIEKRVVMRYDCPRRGSPAAETGFETGRLFLEPLRSSHAAELFGVLSDERLYLYIPQDPPPSPAHLEARFRRLETRSSADGTQAWLNWAVRAKEGGACVGRVEATLLENHTAHLAYEVGATHWGRGIATEACRRVIEALFTEFGATQVVADVDSRNAASMRLLDRLGFTRGALTENADSFKGSASHEFRYTLVGSWTP